MPDSVSSVMSNCVVQTPRRTVLFGRRRGRPLRAQRTALVETLLPRLQLDAPPAGQSLDPATLFASPRSALWLEIGFGGGEHVAAQASAHPDTGFIGCEPFLNGVANLLQHVDRLALTNVRIVPDDARPILDALPSASVARAFVLFPDPWPKTRHHARRFIGPENLDRLARVLEDGAELRLASDDPALIAWMLELTARHPAFAWTAREASDWRQRPADWPATRYEEKALAAARPPAFLRFVRQKRRSA